MAAYLRTRFSHFRHAAPLSLHKAKISPCFHSSNDATAVLIPRWAANVRAFHDDIKLDEIGDGTLGLHDSLKETPHVLVKKFDDDDDALESHVAAEMGELRDSNLDGVTADGGVRDSYISLAQLEEFLSNFRAKENAKWHAIYDEYCKKRRDEGKLEEEKSCKRIKKRVSVVVSLCNATRVREIRIFPSEVLNDNRRLRQLFNAWKKECNVSYSSKAEEMERFRHFKFNVYWTDRENRSNGTYKQSLGLSADTIPGYHPNCMRNPHCCVALRSRVTQIA